MPVRVIFLISLFIFQATATLAQEQILDLFRLGPSEMEAPSDTGTSEVMAASKSLKKAGELPVTVYVITRDEIIGNGYTSLVDAIASLPGVRVSQPGSGVDGEGFQIRGIYGNYYCQILIDGINIMPSVAGGMPVGRQIPIRQAERIEVIFGPASSVYGSEALAGVINIVTHRSERPVTAQADIALGSQGFEYLNVSIGGKVGKNKNVFTYSLFGGNSSQRDLNVKYDRDFLYNPSRYDSTYSFINNPNYQGDSNSIVMGNLPVSSNQLGISFHWRGWSAQALRMSRSAHSSLNRDPSAFQYSDPLDFWAETIQRYHLTYSRKWPKISTESQVSWLSYRLNNQSGFAFLEPAGPSGKSFKYAASDDLHIEEQVTFLPLKGLEVTAGLVYRYSGNLPVTNSLADPFPTGDYRVFSEEAVDDTSVFNGFGFNPVTFHRAAAYAQFYYQWKSLTVLGGFRTDYHSLFDFSHSPRIALMYKTRKGLSLRASFSTGTRVPALYYMYASEARKQQEGIYYDAVPNLSLDPEKLIAAEAGLRWMAAKWFRADIALFYHKIYEQFSRSFVILDPSVYPDATNPAGITRAYVNDANSNAMIIGLQADMLFSDLVKAIDLDADLNLTLAKGRETLPSGLGTIGDYRQMPVFSGEFDISASPVRRLRLSVRNHFSTGWVRGYLPLDPDLLESVGYPVRNEGYYSVDLQGRVFIGRNFEAFAHFNNLTNAHFGGIDSYSDENDLFYNPQHGFNFRIGFNFRME